VVAVGLGPRAEDPRAADHVVVRMAGLVPVSGGAAGVRQNAAHGDRVSGRHLAPGGWGSDLRADRQREDRHDRAHRADRGPPSRHGGGWPALRGDDPDLRAGGSAVQGRVGGDGAHCEGGPGADRGEPGGAIQDVRGTGDGLPGVLRTGQRPRTPGDPPSADRGAGRRAAAAASATGAGLHLGVRADPAGQLGRHRATGFRPLFGSPPADRYPDMGASARARRSL
jgi:hypothetical protein